MSTQRFGYTYKITSKRLGKGLQFRNQRETFESVFIKSPNSSYSTGDLTTTSQEISSVCNHLP